MAAHILTICKQIVNKIGEHYQYGSKTTASDVCNYVDGALSAPGTDGISHPSLRLEIQAGTQLGWDLYGALYNAQRGAVDALGVGHLGMQDENCLAEPLRIPYILQAVGDIMVRCSHLEYYRTLEAADIAYSDYVKRGMPYWKKRRGHWVDWDFHEPPPAVFG